MEVWSPRAATPPASLDSSPSRSSFRSAKRRRVSHSGSPPTSQGSIVTVISSGVTYTFDGRSNAAYKRWLQAIQSTTSKHASFFEEKVCLLLRRKGCCRGTWCLDYGESAMSFSRNSAIHDAHCVRQQHMTQQKSTPFDRVGR
jgi:hypothetical protein